MSTGRSVFCFFLVWALALAGSASAQTTDFRVMVSDSADPVAPNSSVNYQVEVSNYGPSNSPNPVILDIYLPMNVPVPFQDYLAADEDARAEIVDAWLANANFMIDNNIWDEDVSGTYMGDSFNNACEAMIVQPQDLVLPAGTSGSFYYDTVLPSGNGVSGLAYDTPAGQRVELNYGVGGCNSELFDDCQGIPCMGPRLTMHTAAGAPISIAYDGTAPFNDGCEPLINFPVGHVALIDRGACSFSPKADHATQAGASGVIVANTAALGSVTPTGDSVMTMGCTDAVCHSDIITIPAAFISYNAGAALKASMNSGTVRGFMGVREEDPEYKQTKAYIWESASVPSDTNPDNDRYTEKTFLTDGPQCSYSISPTSRNFGSSGGSGTISVVTQTGCPWTATESLSWTSISGGSSGNGSGTVSFTVSSNGSTNSRSGIIQVAGKTFSIFQAGADPCSYSISPTSKSFGSSGGTGTVSVSTASGCNWNAGSNSAWISVTSGSNGSGSGTVGYQVSSNADTSPRSGTITIAGKTFSVSQSGAAAGGSGPYMVAGIAHANGAGGSVWRSTLAITNRSGGPANLTLIYRYGSGSRNQALTLQHGRILEWVDVATSLFGVGGSTSGSIEVQSNRPVIVTARTYNEGADGTFGQFLPGADDGTKLSHGQAGILPQVKKTSAFRTNIGFVNLGESSVSVRTKLFSENGSQLGNSVTTTVPGNQWRQENDVFQKAGISYCQVGYATVEVTTNGGSVWAYASVVDEGTGDPTTIPVSVQ